MAEGVAAPRQRFDRSRRLRRRCDFLRVQQGGVRVSTPHLLLLLAARPDPGPARLGIVASRKVGDAVQRNRAKRLVREAFRKATTLFPTEIDVVIIVRPGASELDFGAVEAELRGVASRIRRVTAQLGGERESSGLAGERDRPVRSDRSVRRGRNR